MSKHTPGPWHISGYNENMGYPEPVIAGMVSDCTAYVAVCIDCAGMTDANARLISAAPDLLEALSEVVAEADSYTERTGKPVYNWLDKARAAIRKALGEE